MYKVIMIVVVILTSLSIQASNKYHIKFSTLNDEPVHNDAINFLVFIEASDVSYLLERSRYDEEDKIGEWTVEAYVSGSLGVANRYANDYFSETAEGELSGICRIPNSNALAFEFSSPAYVVDEQTVELKIFAPDLYHSIFIQTSEKDKPYSMNCDGKEVKSLQYEDHQASFCTCQLDKLITAQKLTTELWAYLPGGESRDLVEKPLTWHDFDIRKTKTLPLNLAPFNSQNKSFDLLLTELAENFDIKRISTPQFDYVQINSVYNFEVNFSYNLVKLAGQWYLLSGYTDVFMAPYRMKGFSLVNDTTLLVDEFCFSECEQLSEITPARIDFQQRQVTLMPHAE